jgi:hypothetical protein
VARVAWAHLCDYAFLDATGKACLIGILSRILAPRVPTTLPRLFLAMEVHGEPHEGGALGLRLLRPDGGELFDVARPLDLGPTGHHLLITAMDNLLLPDFGPYSLDVRLAGQPLHAVALEVLRLPTPSGT